MKAQCLCKAVTIETADNQEIHACHCNNCRKWGGSAGFTVMVQSIKTNDTDTSALIRVLNGVSEHFAKLVEVICIFISLARIIIMFRQDCLMRWILN